jgi:hypothetical protein
MQQPEHPIRRRQRSQRHHQVITDSGALLDFPLIAPGGLDLDGVVVVVRGSTARGNRSTSPPANDILRGHWCHGRRRVARTGTPGAPGVRGAPRRASSPRLAPRWRPRSGRPPLLHQLRAAHYRSISMTGPAASAQTVDVVLVAPLPMTRRNANRGDLDNALRW